MPKQSSKNQEFSVVLNLYKRAGETPLECLNRLRNDHSKDHPEYKEATLSYLGRLDPLASGVLLVAVNEENKKRDQYLSLPKQYEVDILFGVETDSQDVLGLITEHKLEYQMPHEEMIKKTLNEFVGKREVPYPMFSSKPFQGKPLFQLAKDISEQGVGEHIDIPKTHLDIQNIELLQSRIAERKEIEQIIYNAIERVRGDFRQEKIKYKWSEFFCTYPNMKFLLIKVKVECKSGTYMRTLAHEVGKLLGIPALAFEIVRTQVGDFNIKDSIK